MRARLLGRAFGAFRSFGAESSAQRLADQALRVVDRGLGAGLNSFLPAKRGGLDIGVGGDDHRIGAGDVFGGEFVFRADRARVSTLIV